MWGRAFRYLLGWDVFISYGRDDGLEYAQRLYERLLTEKRGTSVYADWVLSTIGKVLPSRIRWALWRTRHLVVILTPGSVQSEFVREEVETFAHVPRLVIPVLATGTQRPEWAGLAGAVWIEEPAEAFEKDTAEPSDRVVARILQAIGANTQAQRTSRIAAGAVVAVLLATTAIGAGTWFARDAARRRDVAVAEMRIAQQRRADADGARRRAETSKQIAEAQRRAAVVAKAEADAQARHQRAVANATGLASNAETLLRREPRHLQRATLLAAESVRSFATLGVPSAAADLALRDALAQSALVRERIVFAKPFGMRAVARDGRHLAALYGDRVELIDIDARRRHMLDLGEGDDPEYTDLAFSEDGSHLIAAVWFDGTSRSFLRIWRTVDGKAVARAASFEVPIEAVALTRDGSHYATWIDDKVRVWHSATHEPASVALQHDQQLRMTRFSGNLRFSPSSGYLVAEGTHRDRVWKWRAATAEEREEPVELPTRALDYHFADDDTLIARGVNGIVATSLPDGKVLWASDTTRRLLEKPEFGGVDADGNHVAVARADTVELYASHGGAAMTRIAVPQPHTVVLQYGRIATLGSDGMARLYDIDSKQELAHVAHPRGGAVVAFRPRGEVVSVSWEDALVWTADETGGDAAWKRRESVFAIAFAPDSGSFATIDHDDDHVVMTVRDAKSGAVVAAQRAPAEAYPNAHAYGRNGVLAAGTDAGEVFVWNHRKKGGLTRLEPRFRYRINTLALSPSSRHVAVSLGPHVFVWDLEHHERKPVRIELGDVVESMAFRGEDELVASCRDDRMRFWRWRQPHVRLTTSARKSEAIVVTDDGLIATVDGRDVALRDASGRVVERIVHPSPVGTVARAGPGRIATAADDGLVRLWERRAGATAFERTRVRLAASGDVPYFFAVSPDSRYLVYSDFSTLRMVQLDSRETLVAACAWIRVAAGHDPAYGRACNGRQKWDFTSAERAGF